MPMTVLPTKTRRLRSLLTEPFEGLVCNKALPLVYDSNQEESKRFCPSREAIPQPSHFLQLIGAATCRLQQSYACLGKEQLQYAPEEDQSLCRSSKPMIRQLVFKISANFKG
jgi:hypothetical protein